MYNLQWQRSWLAQWLNSSVKNHGWMWIVSALNLPPEKYNHVSNKQSHSLRNYYVSILATIRWIKKNQDKSHLHSQQFNNTVMKCTLGFEDQCSYEQQSKEFQSWSIVCPSTSIVVTVTLEFPSLLVCSSCHCSGDWKFPQGLTWGQYCESPGSVL